MNSVDTITDKKSLPDRRHRGGAARRSRRRSASASASTSTTEQWIEDMANLTFTKKEKASITMLVGGLTMAHDYFVEGALEGSATTCRCSTCPTNDGAPGRQGVRQPRPVQPDVLHRRQPGEVPHHAARQARDDRRGDRREVRLPHGGRLRPVPLRHVRHRVPQGAARRRLRRLPRRALPADGRPASRRRARRAASR